MKPRLVNFDPELAKQIQKYADDKKGSNFSLAVRDLTKGALSNE